MLQNVPNRIGGMLEWKREEIQILWPSACGCSIHPTAIYHK